MSSLLMVSLSNYLRTHRKRLALSQEAVGFLLGYQGGSKESKVSRDEHLTREPSLRTALVYEVIYGKPVRELYAGLYDQVEQEVAKRAKILAFRKTRKPNQYRSQMFADLVSKITD